jgi:hypothetical protein
VFIALIALTMTLGMKFLLHRERGEAEKSAYQDTLSCKPCVTFWIEKLELKSTQKEDLEGVFFTIKCAIYSSMSLSSLSNR